MFENEAEEYAERTKTEKELKVIETAHIWGEESLDPNERRLFEGVLDRQREREQGFKDGAEFGYNKANEWHYVKDGEYPKEKQLVMVYRVNPLGANIAITNWYDSYKDTKVIAWKEIVLPKE